MLTKSTPHQDQADLGGSNSPVPNYSSRFDMWLLRHLYSSLGNPQIRITMGGRLEVAPPAAFPVATIAIRDRRTLLQILLDPQLGFGDAYTAGRVTVEGSLVAMLETVFGPCLRLNLAICIPELLRLSWPFCSATPCGAPARTSIVITIWVRSSSASGLTRSSYIPGPISLLPRSR